MIYVFFWHFLGHIDILCYDYDKSYNALTFSRIFLWRTRLWFFNKNFMTQRTILFCILSERYSAICRPGTCTHCNDNKVEHHVMSSHILYCTDLHMAPTIMTLWGHNILWHLYGITYYDSFLWHTGQGVFFLTLNVHFYFSFFNILCYGFIQHKINLLFVTFAAIIYYFFQHTTLLATYSFMTYFDIEHDFFMSYFCLVSHFCITLWNMVSLFGREVQRLVKSVWGTPGPAGVFFMLYSMIHCQYYLYLYSTI